MDFRSSSRRCALSRHQAENHPQVLIIALPEMLSWCGREHRVERRAEKTCVDVAPPEPPNRRFAGDDVVFLEGPRCDGAAHDGCRRGCKVFWKEAWLRPIDKAPLTVTSGVSSMDLPSRLKTKSDSRYFCQSTQLREATEAFPAGPRGLSRLRVALQEIRNRDRSVGEIVKLFAVWSWRRSIRTLHGDRWLRGSQVRTPVVSLELKPGEPVRVKSRGEIRATLDDQGSNRGLKICAEMARCCGAEAEVRGRVERIIDERTGRMRELGHTVTIHNIRSKAMAGRDMECLCSDEPGDCARGEVMYWREAWLGRANNNIEN
jgi:hypothetical protein